MSAAATQLEPAPAPVPRPVPRRGVDPWRSLRAHPWLALLVLGAMVGAGLPISLWKGRPYYYAECVVYISPTFLKYLQEDKEVRLDSDSQYREFVQQNARTMNRYDVVFDALERLGPRRYTWQLPKESERRAAERLQGALQINPVPDTYQVAIGLEGTHPEGLAEIVNTVADVYIQKEHGEDFYASDQRVASLRQERGRLASEIDSNDAAREQISRELAVSSFTESFENPYDRLILQAKENLAAARQKRYEAESLLSAVDPDRPESKAALLALAQDHAAQDSALISLESNLNQRRALLLAQISGLAPAHPGRKAIEREIAEIDQQLNSKNAELTHTYGQALLDERRAEVAKSRQVEEALSADLERESAQAADFSRNYQRGLSLGMANETARKQIDAIDQRINFLSMESDAPGFTRVFSYARPADVPVRSNRRRLFLLFVAAGLLLAVAAPVGVDYLDPRIRLPEDAERVLGFAPMGWVAERSQSTPEFLRDQVLRIAAGIQREAERSGARVAAFTSAQPGAGTTTLCFEIAQELRGLGASTMVIEANAFKPDARYPGGPGLAECLRGERVRPAASATALGAGDSRGQRHLPNLKELRPLLADFPGDLLLLDAPPLLLSADAEFLARSADLVFLVVEAGALTRSELARAAGWLERAQPSAAGVIVNRVRVEEGTYYRDAMQQFESGERRKDSGRLSRWLWK